MSRPSRTKSRYSLDKGLKIGPDGKEEEPEDTKSIQNGPNVYVSPFSLNKFSVSHCNINISRSKLARKLAVVDLVLSSRHSILEMAIWSLSRGFRSHPLIKNH
jgi:hypothetical protein